MLTPTAIQLHLSQDGQCIMSASLSRRLTQQQLISRSVQLTTEAPLGRHYLSTKENVHLQAYAGPESQKESQGSTCRKAISPAAKAGADCVACWREAASCDPRAPSTRSQAFIPPAMSESAVSGVHPQCGTKRVGLGMGTHLEYAPRNQKAWYRAMLKK